MCYTVTGEEWRERRHEMFYRIVEIKDDDEFIINTTEDKAAAIEEARDFWATLCKADKKRNRVEVREYEKPDYYLVSYYRDGECIGDEMRQA